MTVQTLSSPDHFLRRTLYANAAFCTLAGLLVLPLAGTLATFTGWPDAAEALRIIAVIIFAYGLLPGALNQRSVRAAGIMATTLDLVWSLGSYGLLLTQALPVNVTGSWVVLIVADFVLIFALVQLYGVWRWRRLKQTGN